MTITRETLVNSEATDKIVIRENASLEYWRLLKERAMRRAKSNSMFITSRIVEIKTKSGHYYIFKRCG